MCFILRFLCCFTRWCESFMTIKQLHQVVNMYDIVQVVYYIFFCLRCSLRFCVNGYFLCFFFSLVILLFMSNWYKTLAMAGFTRGRYILIFTARKTQANTNFKILLISNFMMHFRPILTHDVNTIC